MKPITICIFRIETAGSERPDCISVHLSVTEGDGQIGLDGFEKDCAMLIPDPVNKDQMIIDEDFNIWLSWAVYPIVGDRPNVYTKIKEMVLDRKIATATIYN